VAGIRVLELARILAGPWIWPDLGRSGRRRGEGASGRGSGDDMRAHGARPPWWPTAATFSVVDFHACNRGKRSVAVDFETPEGRETVRRLASHADVLVENFKVGGLAKFGLDAQSLLAANPASSTAR